MKAKCFHRFTAAAGLSCSAQPLACFRPRRTRRTGAPGDAVPLASTPGFSEVQPDGTRTGLILDYLTEIAKIHRLEYEYVDASSEDIVSFSFRRI